MPHNDQRRSPAGRPIRIRENVRPLPEWVARRRRVYRLIDSTAERAKRLVRRWLVPRPTSAPRASQRMA
jgi:hypothetical protein